MSKIRTQWRAVVSCHVAGYSLLLLPSFLFLMLLHTVTSLSTASFSKVQSRKTLYNCLNVYTSHSSAVCVCMERSEYVLRDGAERARDQLERYQSLVKRRKTGGQTEKDEREERESLREERRHSSCSRFYCVRRDGGSHTLHGNRTKESIVMSITTLCCSRPSHHSLQYVPNSCQMALATVRVQCSTKYSVQ